MPPELDPEQLIETWRGPLIGMLAAWGAPWSDAVELAQDVFAEAFLARSRFRGNPASAAVVGPWLRGIAKNLFRSWRRDRAKRQSRDLAAVDPPPSADAPDQGRREETRAAIAQLCEEHRQVIYMRYFEDASHAEVAALLGISERAVEGRLYKARAALRQILSTERGRDPEELTR